MKRYIPFILALSFALVGQAQKTKTFVFHHGGKAVLNVPVNQVDSIVLVDDFEIPDDPEPTVDYEPVDLGLSVKWAPFNIGATCPEEYGDYYSFGALNTQEVYDESAMSKERKKLSDEQMQELNTLSDISGSSVDVALAKWGGLWRIPTWKEWRELCEECTWEWTTQNDVCGMKVTGPNGNSIFLPASGYMRSINSSHNSTDPASEDGFDGLVRAGRFASYTTSGTTFPGAGTTGGVIYCNFKENFRECSCTEYLGNYMSASYYGRCVRPVYGEHTDPGVLIDQRKGLLAVGSEGWNGDGPRRNWTHYDNWDTETMLGEWYGVITDEKGRIVELNWENNNLWGFHVNTQTVNGYYGVHLPYLRKVNINNNPNIGYHGIGIKDTQIHDLMLDHVGFSSSPYEFEGIANLTIQNCSSQFYYIKGDFDSLTIKNIHAEPYNWDWSNDDDMPFVLKEGTAKIIIIEGCDLETDVIAACEEMTIRDTKVEHHSYSSSAIDDGHTKPSRWKTQITKRFNCSNCTLIVEDLDYDDFADGCEMTFDNVTLVLKNGTKLTNFSASFTNSAVNWRQVMQ